VHLVGCNRKYDYDSRKKKQSPVKSARANNHT
jgi:hypothetical protein